VALHNRRNGNLEAIQGFAEQFTPKLAVVPTRAVGGQAVTNGYMASLHDPELELGITAVVWGGGHAKVWMELMGTAHDAADLGAFFAAALKGAYGLVDHGGAEPPEDLQEIDRTPQPFWNNPVKAPATDYIGGPASADPQPEKGPPSSKGAFADWVDRYEAEGKGVEFRKELEAEFPNPQLIDMMSLSAGERHDLVMLYPDLAFRITAGERFFVSGNQVSRDDRAGFCTAQQLAAVRTTGGMSNIHRQQELRRRTMHIPVTRQVPMSQSGVVADEPLMEMPELKPMGAPPKPNCDHQWERNSVGDGEICRKCGGFQRVRATRSRQAALNAERQLQEMAAAAVREKHAADCAQGQHFFVQAGGEPGADLACHFCGAAAPRKPKAAPEAPEGDVEGDLVR
jgi:hypothetical protein